VIGISKQTKVLSSLYRQSVGDVTFMIRIRTAGEPNGDVVEVINITNQ